MQQQDEMAPELREFLAAAVEQGQVWGLTDDEGWALAPAGEDASVMVLPLWSAQDAAALAASEEWADYVTEAIALDDLLEHWLPGLDGDGYRVGLNWSAELEGIEVPPLELQADLESAIVELDDAADTDV